ncbi:MAG TPA: hypothetical protein VL651_16715 [Bacteroidia bacterium]|jgi:uncharacterized membrane protein YbhN (UPF0104 family)|nr:hypothetical protein [Bacteroidia bacterium]
MNLQNRNRTLSIIIKSGIVALSSWYILSHARHHLVNEDIVTPMIDAFGSHRLLFTIVLLLMPINWMLESWKWKILASQIRKISLGKAMKGVLAGVTIGTATPNRVGEFAGRIYSVDSDDKKNLLILSFVASLCQVIVTVATGSLVFFFHPEGSSSAERIFIVLAFSFIILSVFLLLTGHIPVQWKTRFETLKNFSGKLFTKVLALSFLRYSVYVTQFFLLLFICDPSVGIIPTISSIAVAYLIVTLVPTFSVTEVLVRGSVAGMCIGNDDHLSAVAFYVAALLWTINVAIPSLAGIYFVFRLQFFRKA